jgi:hypothetical protein
LMMRNYTIFAEVENIVNSRPLTPVSDGPTDLATLTPNDLLRRGQGFTSPPRECNHLDTYGKRWRYVQFLVDEFWKRWTLEYLPTLTTRTKWLMQKRNIQVGDIVIVLMRANIGCTGRSGQGGSCSLSGA